MSQEQESAAVAEVLDAPVENPEEASVETEPVPAPLTWEKREELRQHLDASKREALSLKAEKEQLQAQLRAAEMQRLTGVTQSDVEAFKLIAKQAGVPLAEDIQAEKIQAYEKERDQMVNKFLEKHPEYAQPGDPKSDAMWAALDSEVSQYVAPADPKDWYKILEKNHKLLTMDDSITLERGKSLGMAQAKLQEQHTVGGSRGSASSRKASIPVDPLKEDVQKAFKEARPEYFG